MQWYWLQDLRYKILIKHRKIRGSVSDGTKSSPSRVPVMVRYFMVPFCVNLIPLNLKKGDFTPSTAVRIASPFMGGRKIRPINSTSRFNQGIDFKLQTINEQQAVKSLQSPTTSPKNQARSNVRKISNLSLPPIAESPKHDPTGSQHPPLTRKHAMPLNGEDGEISTGRSSTTQSPFHGNGTPKMLDDTKPKLVRERNVRSSFFGSPEAGEVLGDRETLVEDARSIDEAYPLLSKSDSVLTTHVCPASRPDHTVILKESPLVRHRHSSSSSTQCAPVRRRRSSPTILQNTSKNLSFKSKRGRTENDIPVVSLRKHKPAGSAFGTGQVQKQNLLKSVLHSSKMPGNRYISND